MQPLGVQSARPGAPELTGPAPREPSAVRSAVWLFETVLWQSRLLTLVAVTTSLALWLVMLFITTVDAVYLVARVLEYSAPALSSEARLDLRSQVISSVIGIVDGYLIASALFIFTLGLYRQFVNRLEVAEASEMAPRILDVNSFEDLKGRLARVIVLILIVKFLQLALSIPYNTTTDLLLLALGTVFIGGAIYLSHGGAHAKATETPKKEQG